MIGIIYSTVDGHTLKICERLKEAMERQGLAVSLQELKGSCYPDLDAFDQVVIGASIRYGNHRPELSRFVEENIECLAAKRAAFFSVSAVARKAEKREAHTNPYVRKFLAKSGWKPSVVGVFGGKIDYSIYRFWDRTMIRFIMWLTNGPTDLDSSVEFTDWADVDVFADAVCTLSSTDS